MMLETPSFTIPFIIVLTFAALGTVGPFFTADPFAYVGHPWEPPSQKYLLGTDLYGRDVFAQTIYGIRNTMLVGIIGGTVALMIAVLLGGLSGYMRGLVGEALNAIINIFLVIPTIPLLIILSVLIQQRSLWLVAVFIGLITAWPGRARALRAQVMSLRQKEFVNLAIITAKKTRHIVLGEIFSNMIAYIFFHFCGAFAQAMMAEAGISLLGLGPVDVPTLGMILHWAIMTMSLQFGKWWLFIPPGLILVSLIISLFTMNASMSKLRQLAS